MMTDRQREIILEGGPRHGHVIAVPGHDTWPIRYADPDQKRATYVRSSRQDENGRDIFEYDPEVLLP